MGQGHEPRSVRPRLSQRPGRPTSADLDIHSRVSRHRRCLLQQRTEHCRGAFRVSFDGRAGRRPRAGCRCGRLVGTAHVPAPPATAPITDRTAESRSRTAAPRPSPSRSAEFISSFDHARDRAIRQPSALLPLSRGSNCVPRLAPDLVALALERLAGVREPDGSGRPYGPRYRPFRCGGQGLPADRGAMVTAARRSHGTCVLERCRPGSLQRFRKDNSWIWVCWASG